MSYLTRCIITFFFFGFSFFLFSQTPYEYYNSGDFENTIRVSKKRLTEIPVSKMKQRLTLYHLIGWSYLRQKNYQSAYKLARDAEQENAKDIRIKGILGESLFYLNKFSEAKPYLTDYINNSTNSDDLATMYYLLGSAYANEDLNNYAEIAYHTAVRIPASFSRISWWITLGKFQESIGKTEEAIRTFEIANKLAPNRSDISNLLKQLRESVSE